MLKLKTTDVWLAPLTSKKEEKSLNFLSSHVKRMSNWQRERREKQAAQRQAAATTSVATAIPTPAAIVVPSPTTPKQRTRPVPVSKVESPRYYFGTHNKMTFDQANLVEGVNYTRDALYNALNQPTAYKLTSLIEGEMPTLTDDDDSETAPFTLYECCAGIGTTTLGFLDSPYIERVISTEADPRKREMLAKNIAAYHYQHKSTITRDAVMRLPSVPGSVVYMDLINGGRQPRLGGQTIQDWLAKLTPTKTALVVIRVIPKSHPDDPGVTVPPVQGWSITTNDSTLGPNGRLLIATSSVGMAAATANARNKAQELAAGADNKLLAWQNDLVQFLSQILSIILPAEMIPAYFEPEQLRVWMQAFTHESMDANFNYEELEILGDRVLDLVFVEYLMARIPGIKKNGISALKDRYMSKVPQRSLSQQWGFGNLVRVRDMRVNIHVYEDVFESFFGALFTVSNNVSQKTLGYLNCLNMIITIFEKVEINLAFVHGRGITQIKEMFEGLGWGQPITYHEVTPLGDRVDIYITDAGYWYLVDRGIPIDQSGLIGSAIADTQKLATHTANDAALEYLESIGVTRDFIANGKEEREFSNARLAPFYNTALSRAQKEGFVKIKYFVPRTGTTKRRCVVQLQGVRPDGEVVTLKSLNACNSMDGKAILLEQYARGE